MNLFHILILAVVQGLAEMLPVSSSAHVILVEKWLGLDPSAPDLTFLLVMLHTGTMFAALAFFWSRWKTLLVTRGMDFIKQLLLATVLTGVVGFGLKKAIEKFALGEGGEIESLFGNLWLVGGALFAAGVVILLASRREEHAKVETLNAKSSVVIGVLQGFCIPFRGFSRSGATISAGLWLGVSRRLSEEFSFALAILLTPPAILMEAKRLKHATGLTANLGPGLIGMVLSFAAAFIALKWLSNWLENGKWKFFGYYCLVFSLVVFATAVTGH
jgi:undecaprenyl-diphosphatase